MKNDAAPHRILELDGIRGIAILSVIIFHAFDAPLLWAGVDLFFVLSGFLITGILIRRKESGGSYYGYFYSRRARRILAPYVLWLVVASLVFSWAWLKYWWWFAFFATNIGQALDQFGDWSLRPLWSLAVEEQFYLIWPLIVLLASPKRLLRVSIAAVLLAPILRGLCTHLFSSHLPIYLLTPFRMDLLGSGAILAWLQRWKPLLLGRLSRWALLSCAASVCLLIGGYFINHQFRQSGNTVAGNVLIYSLANVMVTSIIAIALTGTGALCHLFRNQVLRYIGRISYSMYLVHTGAILLAARMVHGKISVFLVGLALAVAYASLSWYGFERRLNAHSGRRHKASPSDVLPAAA